MADKAREDHGLRDLRRRERQVGRLGYLERA